MWIAAAAFVTSAFAVLVIVFEYRLRKPDHFILYDSNGSIGFRTSRFYPRHFSLALPATTHLMELKVDSVVRGSIQIQTRLTVTVAPSKDTIAALVRAGGWKCDAVVKAAREFETVLQGWVKEFTEKCTIEELASENLSSHLNERIGAGMKLYGLDLVSLTVQSIDAVDGAIAEAMRQQESARILERTGALQEKARIAAAQAKFKADEEIALMEHQFALQKYSLRKEELLQESQLAQKRIEDELERSRLRLAYEKEEMALLKENPELLLLTPQAARLAEASQGMKNARTIVSLSPSDLEQGSRLAVLFQRFVQSILEGRKSGSS